MLFLTINQQCQRTEDKIEEKTFTTTFDFRLTDLISHEYSKLSQVSRT